MSRVLSTIVLFLMSCSAYAAAQDVDAAATAAPVETVDLIYVIIFGVLFVGTIVGFFVYLWWLERKRKPGEKGPE